MMAVNAYLQPIRARRAELVTQPNYIREVLKRGIQRAREVGGQTLDDVRRAMNMRIKKQECLTLVSVWGEGPCAPCRA